ncbi:hypothetical protein G9A89_008097 [Geosiphon pyriformis]|nr:hypothetical protein G9A89_008097 [Geosiphon pyriformis]
MQQQLDTTASLASSLSQSPLSASATTATTTTNKPKPKKTFSLSFDKLLNFMAAPLSPSNSEPGGLGNGGNIGHCTCSCNACLCARKFRGSGGFFSSSYHGQINQSGCASGSSLVDLDESCLISINTPLDIYGLRYLLSLDRYARQDDFRESLQLHTHLLGIALAARVYYSLDQVYAHLHDMFKHEQRAEFAASYNYLQDTQDAILEYALAAPQPRSSFLDYISFKCSKTILEFLMFVRQTPDIVATAFQQMHSQDLDTLLTTEKVTLYTNGSINNREALLNNLPSINRFDIVDILLKGIFGPSSFLQEDRLRMRMWAEIFARLIAKKKGERFLLDVLDRYAFLSPWTAKKSFELQLMKILQRGDTLLENVTDEEVPKDAPYSAFSLPFLGIIGNGIGVTNNGVPKPSNISIPLSSTFEELGQEFTSSEQESQEKSQEDEKPTEMELFLDRACLELLLVLDRDDVIPARILSLSRAILKQVPEQFRHHATVFLIVQWFFHRFLGRAITYPEHYGMFEEYYISDEQRQKILFMIHQRLYRYVTGITDAVPEWARQKIFVDENIKMLVYKMVARFSEESNHPEINHELLSSSIPQMATPALKSAAGSPYPSTSQYPPTITPTLLICPSDLTTLFHFLCPRYRPQRLRQNMSPRSSKWNSGSTYHSRTNSPRPSSILSLTLDEKLSAASSLFFPSNSDTSSISSASSVDSGVIDGQVHTTTLKDINHGAEHHNFHNHHRNGHSRSTSTFAEDEPLPQIYEDVKKAIDEINRHSGSSSQNSSPHPISEPWALLYVSRDGKEVVMSAPSIAVDTSQTNPLFVTTPILRGANGSNGGLPELELDMPLDDDDDDDDDDDELNELLTEEVRTIGRALFRILREYDFIGAFDDLDVDVNESVLNSESTDGSKPKRQEESAASSINKQTKASRSAQKTKHPPTTITISSLLSKAIQTAQAHKDFAAALLYHQALTLLLHQPVHLTHNNAAGLITLLAKPLRRAQHRRIERHQKRRHWSVYAHEVHLRLVQCLSQKRDMISSLRLRMWYASEIRTSKVLEKSKNFLNDLVSYTKQISHKNTPKTKNNISINTTSKTSLHKDPHNPNTTSKTFEPEWPPPLSEHDSEIVSRWLHNSDVYNFLPCEERFHRYCIEIDSIRRNVMQTMLWTSDLFRKEAMIFKMGYFIDREERERNKKYSGLHHQLLNSYQNQRTWPATGEIRRHNSLADVFSEKSTNKRERRGSASIIGSAPTNAGSNILSNGGRPRRGSSSSSLGLSSSNLAANLCHVIEDEIIDPVAIKNLEPSKKGVGCFGGIQEQLLSNGRFDEIIPPYELYTPPMPFPPSFLIGAKRNHGTSINSGRSSFGSPITSMDEFKLQTQMKLTGLLLSDFGRGWQNGCETDAWFEEFVGDIRVPKELDLNFFKLENPRDENGENGNEDLNISSLIGKGIAIPKPPVKDLEVIVSQMPSLNLSDPITVPEKKSLVDGVSLANLVSPIAISETESAEAQLAEALERSPFIPPITTLNSEKIPPLNNELNNKPFHHMTEYPFTKCCKYLMEEFSIQPSPYQKLHALFAIEMLIVASLSFAPPLPHLASALSTPTSAPLSPVLIASPLVTTVTPGTDSIVNELERLFRQSNLRPKNLFRDMQLVATLIPSVILDLRDEGKAFWDMSLAVSSLKKEVVEKVVERGVTVMDGGIIERDNSMRKAIEKEDGMGEKNDWIEVDQDYEMIAEMEAVRLFTIGAKESNPTAQRELAILYLSLPSLPHSSSPPPPPFYYQTKATNEKLSHNNMSTNGSFGIFGSLSALSTSTPAFTMSPFSSQINLTSDFFSPKAQQGDKFAKRWLNHRDGKLVGALAGKPFLLESEDEEDEDVEEIRGYASP